MPEVGLEPEPTPASPSAAAQPVLAFDYGDKRIGVAVGERAIGMAHPLETIVAADDRRRLEAIAQLVREWRPARLIVGIPGGIDVGHSTASRVRGFARALARRFRVPVDLVDEHLSSWEASRELTRTGIRARAQKKRIDALAACIILERWFEAQPRG
jgi:putative Holliday junction resolvase